MSGLLDGLTPHQRYRQSKGLLPAQWDRNYETSVPDDSFLAPNPQGPSPMPRNAVADWLRERGLTTYADRLNDPTSGIGLAVDAVAGIGNAAIVEPVNSWMRMLNDAGTGQRLNPEDAFNVAGAAMVGGLAAPRPSGVLPKPKSSTDALIADVIASNDAKNRAMSAAIESGAGSPTTYRGYSGSETATHFDNGFTRGPWASPSADVANTYATSGQANVAPMEFKFKNPTVINADGSLWKDVPLGDGATASTNALANHARNAGHDGIVFQNVRDNLSFGGAPGDVYHALRPGTVYSPLTGELLYANGGRSGAATGAAINALSEQPSIRAYRGQPDDRRIGKHGEVWASTSPSVADVYASTTDAVNPSGDWGKGISPRIIPIDAKFKNPLVIINDDPVSWNRLTHNGQDFTTDQLSEYARNKGHDGLVISNLRDGSEEAATTIAALKRGTTYSALTGELLYANGGRPGAATGTAVNALGASEQPSLLNKVMSMFGKSPSEQPQTRPPSLYELAFPRDPVTGRLLGSDGKPMMPLRSEQATMEPPAPAYQVSPDLPMDQASRMGRARALGFNTDQRLFHGTTEDFQNFRRDTSDLNEISGNFLSTSPQESGIYAGSAFGELGVGADGGRIFPVFTRIKNPARLDVNTNMPIDPSQRDALVAIQSAISEGGNTATEALRNAGFDGVEYHQKGNHIWSITFDPKDIRSTNAAFDPHLSDKNGLLYANGGRPGAALNPLFAQYYGQPQQSHWSDRMQPGDM